MNTELDSPRQVDWGLPRNQRLLEAARKGLFRGQDFTDLAGEVARTEEFTRAAPVLQALVEDTRFLSESFRQGAEYFTSPEGETEYEELVGIYATWERTGTHAAVLAKEFDAFVDDQDPRLGSARDEPRLPKPSEVVGVALEKLDGFSAVAVGRKQNAIGELQTAVLADATARLHSHHTSPQVSQLHQLSYPQPATVITSETNTAAPTGAAPPGHRARAPHTDFGR